jgi:PAS domain S-box-containing protein
VTKKPTYEELEQRIQELESTKVEQNNKEIDLQRISVSKIPKILIVDDELRLCASIKTLLSTQGYEVDTCKSGNEALCFLTKNAFDLVILDIFMEGMDGFQVFENIKNKEIDTSVIILTGNASTESAVKALRMRADDYLKKPFEQEELFSAVKNILNQRVLKKENERRKKALLESEKKYQQLVEYTVDSVWSLDIKGVHTFMNKSIEQLLGYTVGEITGNPFFSLMHPDDKDGGQKSFQELVDQKKGWSKIGLRFIHKDGSIRYFESSGHPIFDVDDNLIGFNGVGRDVTDRKKAEEKLRESEKRLKYLSKNSTDWIWEFDENEIFTYASPSIKNLLGYSPEEIIGQSAFDPMSSPEGKRVMEEFILSKNAREPFSALVNVNQHKNGSEVILESSGVPIIDDKGIYLGYRGIDRDITLRKLFEERLVSLNKTLEQKVQKRTNELKKLNEHLIYAEEKERSNFAADLHDTVVQTLGFSISKIKNMEESDDANNAAILSDVQELIKQSLNEIRQLIYRLCPPALKEFDIDIAIDFLVEDINKKFHVDIQYINTFDNSVDIDEIKKITLYRVANELILNILKHSGVKKGKIELSKNQDTVLLKVEDSGIGFDMATINGNPFNGFGLFALSERCKNIGGNIKIKSIPGEGTKVVLYIPLN